MAGKVNVEVSGKVSRKVSGKVSLKCSEEEMTGIGRCGILSLNQLLEVL